MFLRVNPNDPLGMIHFPNLKVKSSDIDIDIDIHNIFDIQYDAFCIFNILTLQSASQISGLGHQPSQFVISDEKKYR